jgi:hypothetical protein
MSVSCCCTVSAASEFGSQYCGSMWSLSLSLSLLSPERMGEIRSRAAAADDAAAYALDSTGELA